MIDVMGGLSMPPKPPERSEPSREVRGRTRETRDGPRGLDSFTGSGRRWASILAGYLVLIVVVAIPTTVLYRFAEPAYRLAVLRAAASLVLGVVLLHVRAVVRESIDSEAPSRFDAALVPSASERVVDRAFQQLHDEFRFGARSLRYFEHALWRRLLALSERLGGSADALTKPEGRRWLRRGPSLRSLGQIVAALERTASHSQ